MRLAYYPGCSARTTCAELNVATHVVADRLGIELTDIHAATCTGARELRITDPIGFYAVNIRILAMAERLSLPLMTICNTCTLNLLDAAKQFSDDSELAAAVNTRLAAEGLEYKGTTRITHFLWVLLEDVGEAALRAAVRRPLHGLTVAAFYGCHITRPPEHYGFVDSRNAASIEKLAKILGSRPIDYSGRTECCGFHTAAHDEKISVKLTGQHISSAKQAGADTVVTPCPLCHTILDVLQPEMNKDLGTDLNMPILHLPQLVGLAMGMTIDALRIDRHIIFDRKIRRLLEI